MDYDVVKCIVSLVPIFSDVTDEQRKFELSVIDVQLLVVFKASLKFPPFTDFSNALSVRQNGITGLIVPIINTIDNCIKDLEVDAFVPLLCSKDFIHVRLNTP